MPRRNKPEDEAVVEAEVEAEQETTDGSFDLPADTAPVEGVEQFILWNAVEKRFVAGPFVTQEDAQLHLNFVEEKASRSANYSGPTLSIAAVTLV